MAVISWGKPTIEIAICDRATSNLPQDPVWIKIDTPVDGTSQLETADGDKTEAIEEGGAVVDTYTKKSKYTFSFELFQKKGATKPIQDSDGVIMDNYAIRLTPEDSTCTGFIFKKASVSSQTTWNSADGGRWKYTFDALQPASGNLCEEYIADSDDDEDETAPTIQGASSLTVPATAGESTRTYATSNGAGVTAQTDAEWLTVAASGNKVTFTRTAYEYAASGDNPRVATVVVGIAGTEVTMNVTVSQAMAAE
ncbi:MAG: hypothetical protein IJP79_07240 [Paludibacteraceae bacterium]|nr:hypothetical protein [Paludibacteraceae bacterium]MBQ6963478.1 hypothetical protein [Paludibacteraceae bacterium]MBQ7662508.1 hypothetical protein [Prevotella sp.]MBQ7748267.1 hypothetical protein [Paludibacteraceae bacterium]